MPELTVRTGQKRVVVDITDRVEAVLPAGSGGAVLVTVLHTTAALTTADLDPGTDLDLLDALEALIPERRWRHPHNPAHAPDHLLASIIGPSVTLPVEDGRLMLGTWQRLIFVELDGPRDRRLAVVFLPAVA